MGGELACVAWVGRARVGEMLLQLLLFLLKYYTEETNVECLLLKQNEKTFQIILSSDLKEEPNVGKYGLICLTL